MARKIVWELRHFRGAFQQRGYPVPTIYPWARRAALLIGVGRARERGRAGLYGGAPFPSAGAMRGLSSEEASSLSFHILGRMVAGILAALGKSQLLGRAPHKEGLGCG